MKKLAALAVATLFLNATAALAGGFTGNWEGPGTLVATGYSAPCSVISLSMEQSPAAFTILSGKVDCGQVKTEITPATFALQGTNVLYNNQVIGTVTDSQLIVNFVDPAGTAGINAVITNGSLMSFTQTMSGQGNTVTISGNLVRK